MSLYSSIGSAGVHPDHTKHRVFMTLVLMIYADSGHESISLSRVSCHQSAGTPESWGWFILQAANLADNVEWQKNCETLSVVPWWHHLHALIPVRFLSCRTCNSMCDTHPWSSDQVVHEEHRSTVEQHSKQRVFLHVILLKGSIPWSSLLN